MKNINLRSASVAFAIANTPLFLAAKLKEDSSVREVAQHSARDILTALRYAIKAKPSTFDKEVAPYVYLVALSLKGDGEALRQAASYSAPFSMWYRDICNFLIQTLRPAVYATTEIATSPVLARQSQQTNSTANVMSSFALTAQ